MNELYAPHDWMWYFVHALPGELPAAVLVYALVYAHLPGICLVAADVRAWARRRRCHVDAAMGDVDASQDLMRIQRVIDVDGVVTWQVSPLADGLGDLRRRPHVTAPSSPRG